MRALKLFTEKNSRVTPVLLGYKVGSQDACGLVPGGFVCYLAWNVLPGVRLDDKSDRPPLFWELPRFERDDIRMAFEYTHKYVRTPGIFSWKYADRMQTTQRTRNHSPIVRIEASGLEFRTQRGVCRIYWAFSIG